MADQTERREQMVATQIAARGIRDPRVLAAMRSVPREAFLSGSGYAAAIVSRIAAHVYTVERHAELAESAQRKLVELGFTNVSVLHGDGTLGCAAHPESYERLCHDSGVAAFFLHLRAPKRDEVRAELAPPRLERAIGVVYCPETELQSHYFHAALPYQFDEYVWFDETHAVRPVTSAEAARLAAEHPFAIHA